MLHYFSYKVVVYMQKFIAFVIHPPQSCRKYLGNKQLWKIYQSIPAESYKINTAIGKDQQENMETENVYYVQRNLY